MHQEGLNEGGFSWESIEKNATEEMCNVLKNEEASLLLEKMGKYEFKKDKEFILLVVFLSLFEHSKIKMKKHSERKIRVKIEENVEKLPEKLA